jgi:GMP synthase-like glutamine amidotransferase
MKIAALFHASFETLGAIEDWINTQNHSLTRFPLFHSPVLPSPFEVDMLVMMGGPMGVNEEAIYPWLIAEKELIRQCAVLGKPILGICLGAQLIASALGKRVYPGAYREIGWFPVTWTDQARRFGIPAETSTFFHWHGDTFDIPDGAVHLASSEATPNQAFLYNGHIVALQFHPEVKPENVSTMVNILDEELVTAPFVADAETILSGLNHLPSGNQQMFKILDYLESCHNRIA